MACRLGPGGDKRFLFIDVDSLALYKTYEISMLIGEMMPFAAAEKKQSIKKINIREAVVLFCSIAVIHMQAPREGESESAMRSMCIYMMCRMMSHSQRTRF